MPVYNAEKWIAAAVDSILAQTFADFELIISDNASTDGTPAICEAYCRADHRVRYFRNQKNLGANVNYNAVFRLSRGRYFKWASSNDICDSTLIARCVEVLEARPDIVLCYPKTRLFTETIGDAQDYVGDFDILDPRPYERFRKVLERMKLNNMMNGVLRADILRTVPPLKSHSFADRNMYAELALHGKFFQVPESLFYRRMGKETATHLKSNEEVVRHFRPDLKSPILFEEWQILRGHLSTVWRTPLSPSEKFRLYIYVLRQANWARGRLVREPYNAVKTLTRRVRFFQSPEGHK
ncbi:MAG: glycosyltransferase family 2 protein [Burkholderiales bacterium]